MQSSEIPSVVLLLQAYVVVSHITGLTLKCLHNGRDWNKANATSLHRACSSAICDNKAGPLSKAGMGLPIRRGIEVTVSGGRTAGNLLGVGRTKATDVDVSQLHTVHNPDPANAMNLGRLVPVCTL